MHTHLPTEVSVDAQRHNSMNGKVMISSQPLNIRLVHPSLHVYKLSQTLCTHTVTHGWVNIVHHLYHHNQTIFDLWKDRLTDWGNTVKGSSFGTSHYGEQDMQAFQMFLGHLKYSARATQRARCLRLISWHWLLMLWEVPLKILISLSFHKRLQTSFDNAGDQSKFQC